MEREDFGVTFKAALKAVTVPANESEVREMMEEDMDEASVRDYFGAIIRDLAKEWGIPFLTYEKDELERLSGEFTESDFVKETVGVGNVCERAAVRACMEKAESGRLLFPKQAKSGVTVAAAWFPPRIRFDGEESF